jgi:hypothetical protein
LRSSALPQLAVIATLIVHRGFALTWGIAHIWHLDEARAAVSFPVR